MALSELGLTQAEVDSIMADVTGVQSPPSSAVPPKPLVTAAPPKPPAPPVKVSDGGSLLSQPKTASAQASAPNRTGAIVVGVTTGLVLGGPPGALVGGAAMWLASKLIKPKT